MKTLLLLLICVTFTSCQENWVWIPDSRHLMGWREVNSSYLILNLTSDVIKDTDEKIRAIENLRLDNFRSAPFEIGYLNYVIVEEYRKMIDSYNTSVSMGGQLYAMETILYLLEIEAHYWQIDHLCNMQHEIEKKYKVTSGLKEEPIDTELLDITLDPNIKTKGTRKTRDRFGEQIQAMIDRLMTTRKKSTRWWWPLEYGWEIDYYW